MIETCKNQKALWEELYKLLELVKVRENYVEEEEAVVEVEDSEEADLDPEVLEALDAHLITGTLRLDIWATDTVAV